MADLRSAWQITQGRGVTVAILAGGVDAAAAGLRGKVIQGPAFGPVRGASDVPGTVFASAVAGTGPSSVNASGTLGLAPAARILSIRAPQKAAQGVWQNADASAIRYAVQHGAQVIFVLSVGYGDTLGLASAVQDAVSRGAVVVGDEYAFGSGGNKPEFPNSAPGVIPASSAWSSTDWPRRGGRSPQPRAEPMSPRPGALATARNCAGATPCQ